MSGAFAHELRSEVGVGYRYYAKEQSPEDRGRYESAEEEAKARKWGLWADTDPINPYDGRKGKR